MKDTSNSTERFFAEQMGSANELMQYLQTLSPDSIARLSQPDKDVRQAMEHTLQTMLGALPSQHFDVSISTSRENLGQLLASAMMNGYFLRGAQQRMAMEKSLAPTFSDVSDVSDVSEADAPEASAPEASAPETDVSDADVIDTDSPEI